MVRVRRVGGLFFGENFLPSACLSFLERGEMFEEFVGVVDGLASLSGYFVVLFCVHGTLNGVYVFCSRVLSVACDAARNEVAIKFSRENGGRFSSCRFVIVLAMRRTLRVGS